MPATSQHRWVPLLLGSSGDESSRGDRGQYPRSKLSRDGLETEMEEKQVATLSSTSLHKLGPGRVCITGAGTLGWRGGLNDLCVPEDVLSVRQGCGA